MDRRRESVAFARGTAIRESINLNAIDDHVRVFTALNPSSSREPAVSGLQNRAGGPFAIRRFFPTRPAPDKRAS